MFLMCRMFGWNITACRWMFGTHEPRAHNCQGKNPNESIALHLLVVVLFDQHLIFPPNIFIYEDTPLSRGCVCCALANEIGHGSSCCSACTRHALTVFVVSIFCFVAARYSLHPSCLPNMKWDAIKLVWHALKGVFTAFAKRNYVLNWEIYDVYRFCSSQLMHDVIGNLFIFFYFFNRKLLLISHINYIFFFHEPPWSEGRPFFAFLFSTKPIRSPFIHTK